MKNLELKNFGVVEMDAKQMEETDGGFLPLAVIGGIWLVQGCCCLVALGMKARLDQERKRK